jgi:hypothetical protein
MTWTNKQLQALTGKAPKKTIIAGAYTSNVKGWRTIGGKRYYFKSLWEINYAHYLEFLKNKNDIKDWHYEPRLFRFPKKDYDAGPFLYKPDFKVITHKSHEWHEVKGWMSPDAKKKLKRFHKHFPEEGTILIVDAAWFKKASLLRMKSFVPGWEALVK